MGISANQARILTLTARKCDLEAQIQKILNNKVALARETANIANAYNDAVSDKKLFVFKPTSDATQSQYLELTAQNLYSNYGLLVAEKVTESTDAPDGYQAIGGFTGTTFVANTGYDTAEEVEAGLRAGTLVLFKNADLTTQDPKNINVTLNGTDSFADRELVDWRTSTAVMDQLNTADDETAQRNYETSMKNLEVKEAESDVEINNVETEHSAITNELESTKKILTKNSEDSFKYFS